tara:strand:- start:218 stop:1003 length:786 start_codon:yes stop_codon:yes gene_type:complete
MKHFYIFLIGFCMGMAPFANAQITLFTDDFETNYNDAVSIDDSDNTWYTFGTDFTFPATNIPTEGAEGSDWHVKLQRNGSDNFAYIERVFELIAGETYEFKAWVLPDVVGQKNAYTLRILEDTNVKAQSATPTQGNTWAEIAVTYVAEASQVYKFRFQKTWGNQGGSMDNYSVVCTTCTTASVEDLSALKFTVSPNPARGIVRLLSNSPLEKVELYSLTGAKILEIKGSDHIDVSNMSSGVYLLKVYSKNRNFVTKKLIIN